MVHFFVPIEQLLGMFVERKFSAIGSVEHEKETATYMLFKQLLEEMEGNAPIIVNPPPPVGAMVGH